MMTAKPFSGQQPIIFVTQQESVPNEQPHIFSSNQSPTFLQHATIINLEPGQQGVQYNPQQPNSPLTSEQSTVTEHFRQVCICVQ